MGEGPANEVANKFVSLNHKLNKAMINTLYNKISSLKTLLNSKNLDQNDLKYVELNTKLEFYSEALENLQQKSMPGITGVEQSDIQEDITCIDQALNTLSAELGGDAGSNAVTSDEAGSSAPAEDEAQPEDDADEASEESEESEESDETDESEKE